MQRHVDVVALAEDRDVVGLHHQRLGERDREDSVAQVQSAAPWLDVHDDVRAGQRLLDGILDRARRLMALDDRLPRRHSDYDVGEVAPRRLAQAQAAQLDVAAELRDRPLGRLARLGRRAVHQHVGVLADQPNGRRADDRRDDERRDGVALREPGVDAQQPDQDGRRAGHVAGEVKGVGAQCGAGVAARDAQRDDRAAEVDDDRHRDHREQVPVQVRRTLVTHEVADRFDGDEDASRDENAGLSQRPQVLCAAVAVGMLRVGRPAAEAHGEERQHSGDHVAAGLDARGDQPEAARRKTDAQLQRDQQAGGGDRHERRTPRREQLLGLLGRGHR